MSWIRRLPRVLAGVVLSVVLAGCASDETSPGTDTSAAPGSQELITTTPSLVPISLPPADAQTAHSGEQGVYIVRPDGSGLKLLSAGALQAFEWSPDGQRLAIVSGGCGNPTVLIYDRTTEQVSEVASFPGLTGANLAWALDSDGLLISSVEYDRQTGSGQTHVYLLHAISAGEPREVFTAGSFAWAPDGKRVAYGRVTEPGEAGDLIALDLQSEETIVVTNDFQIGSIAWSPDGSRIAYTASAPNSPRGNLSVVNSDGSGRVVVAERAGDPVWMPDGNRLMVVVFDESRGPVGPFVTALVDAVAGSKLDVIRSGGRFDASADGRTIAIYAVTYDPDFGNELEILLDRRSVGLLRGDFTFSGDVLALSPDGRRILFNADAPRDPHRSLYISDVDGGNFRRLVQPSVSVGAGADWSADGELIAFIDTIITSCA